MKRHFSKTGRSLLGLALAAVVVMGVGGGAAADAATEKNPASFGVSVSAVTQVSYTPAAQKETAGKPAKIRLAYLYNQTDAPLYLRVVHNSSRTYATEYKKIAKFSTYSGDNPISLDYISTNTANSYCVRSSLENATKGYTAGTGTWWP